MLNMLRNIKGRMEFHAGLYSAKRELKHRNGYKDPSRGLDLLKEANTLSGNISGPLRETLSRIDRRRADLLKCTDEIKVMDWGAGHANTLESDNDSASIRWKKSTVATFARASKSPDWAGYLGTLCRLVEAKTAIEMGTCVGLSASCIGAHMSCNGKGRLITLEGDPSIADIARDTLKACGIDNVSVRTGRFDDIVMDIVQEHEPIDFIFIDGNHKENSTIKYFNDVAPLMRPGGVMVFDDIRWSDGMKRAWLEIIRSDYVKTYIDFREVGLVLV